MLHNCENHIILLKYRTVDPCVGSVRGSRFVAEYFLEVSREI